ncbi:MAG: prolipoprotein diacylglyceryl transferase family protein [Pirellulales bacterium]
MLQTLVVIPERLAGWPLLGMGIIFWLLVAGTGIWLAWAYRREGFSPGVTSTLVTNGLLALVIWQVLPRIVVDVGGVRGIPIRGYGLMMMVGVASGVGLAIYRGNRRGLSLDFILNLAFYMFIAGIIGARLFYVIQKWDQFRGQSWPETLAAIVNFTEGGLVVYGSLIGAAIGFALFVWRARCSPWGLADVIAPSLLVGLAFGRVGCLLNGCCFGGPCHLPWAVHFPVASPPYVAQQEQGQFLGIQLGLSQDHVVIRSIRPDSPASGSPLRPGMRLKTINNHEVDSLNSARYLIATSPFDSRLTVVDPEGQELIVNLVMKPPAHSLPTEPTQIYSALNAVILCLLALAVESRLPRQGMLMALVLGLYAVTRFLEEIIRQDEGSFAGTGLTISQNISIVLLVAALVMAWWTATRGPAAQRPASPPVTG